MYVSCFATAVARACVGGDGGGIGGGEEYDVLGAAGLGWVAEPGLGDGGGEAVEEEEE